jgi:hypothetical protein
LLIVDGSTLFNEFGSHMVHMSSENLKLFPEELVQCVGNKEVYLFKSERQEQQRHLFHEKYFLRGRKRTFKILRSR